MTSLTQIRTAKLSDIEKILKLEKSFSPDPRHHAKPEQVMSRIEKFSQGFFLGFHQEELITSLVVYPIHYDPLDVSSFTSWAHVTNNGNYHDSLSDKANALYIVTGVVDREHRNESYMSTAFDHLTKLAREGQYQYIIAGASLLGYSRYCSKYGFVPAKDYAFLTRRGRSFDPLIERYRQIGFKLPGQDHVIADYYEHAGSLNYAALMVYEMNPSIDSQKINLNDPNIIANPYPTYHRIREQRPVYQDSEGTYFLTRHEDVVKIKTDRSFTRQPQKQHSLMDKKVDTDSPVDLFLRNWLVFQDPPEHTETRELVAKSMRLGELSKSTSALINIAEEIILPLVAKKTFDVMRDFALPFSMRMTSHFMGLPYEHAELYRHVTDAFSYAGDHATPEDFNKVLPLIHQFSAILEPILISKTKSPDEDWLSYLVQENANCAHPRNMQDLVGISIFIFQAANDAPKVSIANAMYTMLTQRHHWMIVCKNPDLLDAAADECHRLETVPNKVSRWSTEDVVLSNTTIPAHSLIVSLLNAANHDPEIFQNPDEIQFNRDPKQHVAFGRGIHTCLGKVLAKIILKITFQTFITHCPNLTLTESGALWRPIISQRYIEELPVKLP